MSSPTKPETAATTGRRPVAWLKQNGPATFRSWDFYLGAGAGVLSALAAGASPAVRTVSVGVLAGEAALGIALLAVALTALAILTGLLNDQFLHVLEVTPGGVAAALRPYRIIATVGALTTLMSMTGIILTAVAAWPIVALVIALSTGLAVWGIWGTVELVGLTAFFGVNRARLLGIRRAAEREVAKIHERRAVP